MQARKLGSKQPYIFAGEAWLARRTNTERSQCGRTLFKEISLFITQTVIHCDLESKDVFRF